MRCKGCRVHILVATGSKSASQKDTTFIVMKIAASHVMDCPGSGGRLEMGDTIFRSRGEGSGVKAAIQLPPSLCLWSGMGTLSHKNLLVFSSPIKLIVFSGALWARLQFNGAGDGIWGVFLKLGFKCLCDRTRTRPPLSRTTAAQSEHFRLNKYQAKYQPHTLSVHCNAQYWIGTFSSI